MLFFKYYGMKKNIFVLLLVSFFLTSCSSTSSSSEVQATGLTDQSTSYFSMKTPEKWTVLSGSTLPTPKQGTISLAVTSDELKYGFASNILVLTQTLEKEVSSKDFSILNNVGSTREYTEYNKLESKSIEFTDKENSDLYIFEARYNTSTPKLKFLQTARVCP